MMKMIMLDQKLQKEYQNNIIDWATQDYSAALQFMLNTDSASPIYWLGHSLGGQVFPLVDNIEQVSIVITVSSGTGYWKHNAPALRRKAPFFWYFIMPIATSLFGYFPGKKIGMVGDYRNRLSINGDAGVYIQNIAWGLSQKA